MTKTYVPPDKVKNTMGKPLQNTYWCNLIVDHAHVRFGHVLHDCGFNTVITVGKWYITVNLYICTCSKFQEKCILIMYCMFHVQQYPRFIGIASFEESKDALDLYFAYNSGQNGNVRCLLCSSA